MMSENPQILILVGAPGSGKSTFAKYFIRTEENWMRLCRDDFRTMQFTFSNLDYYGEELISGMIDASIEVLLKKKRNILLDATHCKAEYLNHYITKFNHLADISFKVFDVDAEVIEERCSKRNAETGKFISKQVQKEYLKELANLKRTFDFSTRPLIEGAKSKKIEQDENLTKALICDLDGTLALMEHRNPFDATHADEDLLNTPVANTLTYFAREGYKILLVSGREDKYKEPTINFLTKYNIPFHKLSMRKSGDYRKDSIIKKEIFEAEIKDKFFIEFVLDDRDQVVDMWRNQLGLSCFQVNYGNF